LGWFARARKCKAGGGPIQVAPCKTGLIKALLDRRHDRDHGGLEPDPDIGRTRHGLGEPHA
jgi:hypothetical protein